MAVISIFLFAGQFAGYVVISEINAQLRSVEAVNAAISNELAASLARGNNATAESLAGLRKRDPAWGRRQVRPGRRPNRCLCPPTPRWCPHSRILFFSTKVTMTYAKALREGKPFHEIVSDHGKLYLRVVSVLPVRSSTLTVVTSEPFDKDLVGKIAADLGEITLYSGTAPDESPGQANPAGDKDSGSKTDRIPSTAKSTRTGYPSRKPPAGRPQAKICLPRSPSVRARNPRISWIMEIPFVTPLRVVDWSTGSTRTAKLVAESQDQAFQSLWPFVCGARRICRVGGRCPDRRGDFLRHHRTDRADHRHAHDPHRDRRCGATARSHQACGSRRFQPSHPREIERPVGGSGDARSTR